MQLNQYRIHFIGRTKGAIGIFYPITAIVNAINEDEARLSLYEQHEHIRVTNISLISTVEAEKVRIVD